MTSGVMRQLTETWPDSEESGTEACAEPGVGAGQRPAGAWPISISDSRPNPIRTRGNRVGLYRFANGFAADR